MLRFSKFFLVFLFLLSFCLFTGCSSTVETVKWQKIESPGNVSNWAGPPWQTWVTTDMLVTNEDGSISIR